MDENLTTAEVLNRAADLIEKHGWTQGPQGWIVDGAKCALGSIGAAVNARSFHGFYEAWEILKSPAVDSLASYLNVDEIGEDGQGIYRWNDAPDRTAEQVIATLRAAALVEASREPEQPEVHEVPCVEVTA